VVIITVDFFNPLALVILKRAIYLAVAASIGSTEDPNTGITKDTSDD
jgi:hypothetical protein